ncbi:hypothetical protein AAFX60_006965 [Aliivibrio fischeri]
MLEPWKDTVIDDRFCSMVEELKAADARAELNQTPEEQAEAEANSERFEAVCANAEARAAVFTLEKLAQKFIHKRIKIDEEVKAEAIENFGPLLVKYGALLPSWFSQYEQEIMALKSMGQIGWDVAKQAKQYKQEDAQAIAQQHNQEEYKEAA